MGHVTLLIVDDTYLSFFTKNDLNDFIQGLLNSKKYKLYNILVQKPSILLIPILEVGRHN